VVDDELRALTKKISVGRFPFIRLEAIILGDSNPGQFLPSSRQFVAAARRLLLRFEQVHPGGKLLTCSGLMVSHIYSPFILSAKHAVR
jgi:hypothetical protein